MGVIKRSIEDVVNCEDPDSAWAHEGISSCQHCEEWGLLQDFERCGDCPSTSICSDCRQQCGGCGINLCPPCANGETEITKSQQLQGPSWTPKTCAECRCPLCHLCRPGSLKCDQECARCNKALCKGLGKNGHREACGQPCIGCGKLTCRECSLTVGDERRCIDCAVERSSTEQQELESPVPATPPKRPRLTEQQNSATETPPKSKQTRTCGEAPYSIIAEKGF